MKRLISHARLLFNIQLVHLFSKTFVTARYNLIIHIIFFLVLFPLEKKMLAGKRNADISALGSSIFQCLQKYTEDYFAAFKSGIADSKSVFLCRGNILKR